MEKVNWFNESNQKEIKRWIAEFANETCHERGNYMPVQEEEDGNLVPIFEEKRFFNAGESFPDERDWIPCLILQ